MDLKLRDRVVLVVGASRGIGLGIAETCLQEGARVALVARGGDALAATARALSARFGEDRVWSRAGDLRQTEVIETVVAAVENELGPIWGAVGNVGLHPCPPGFDIDDATWDAGIDQNLSSAFRLARAVLRRMQQRQGGSLLYISSSAGLASLGGPITYGTAKAAVNHLTKQLAKYVGASGLRVNAIAPGPIRFTEGEWEDRMTGPDAERWRGWLKREIPLNCFGTPHDVGAVAALLLSPIAAFVTGAVWTVDGGHTR